MQVLDKIKATLKKAFTDGWSVKKLTQSFCTGIYIAFSPFPGLHTGMMFAAKFLFKLNFPILFLATSFNNPWTMVAFYSFDYFFGYWLIHTFLGFNPTWTISLARIFGSGKICIWSFLVGGNILGLLFAFAFYTPVYFLFKGLVKKFKKNYENNKL
ncbi:DUF2062 domain-containing protein [Candidatus Dependentiae bacterium]|nr:DUF2062 domain-containing protein [Candidatus Dependentiae bacterium]MBU4387461.1 DUF2062 domain-containing protein [Candidatus Dependentiae bacterium]MCG2756158.1 DUF2062 domain-containing protein [Candidatus Dependentiae bacterium]